jgi:hypothetical protein
MPPASGKATPAEQVRIKLASSKRFNVPFDRAWAFAIDAVRFPHDTTDRVSWKLALAETRWAWEAAYFDAPANGMEEFTRAA